jgi:O-antigen polymerase
VTKIHNLLKSVLLLLFCSLFLYSQPNVGGAGLLMPNNVSLWFIVGLFIIVSLYHSVGSNQWIVGSFATWLTVALIVIFGVSLVNSEALNSVRFMYAVAIAGVILYFNALYQWRITHATFLKILVFLSAIGLLHAFVSIVQIQDPYHVWYVLTGYLPFNLATGRPIGIVQQVNMNATLMATILVVSLYLITHKSFQRYQWYWKGVVFSSTIATTYILVLSGSRAGLLAAMVGLLMVLMARKRAIKNNKTAFFLWVFAALCGFLIAYSFPGSTANNDLLSHKFDQMLMGTDMRLFLYSSGWQLFLQSPWFGYGLGGYTHAFVEYAESIGIPERYQALDLNTFLHPHNELLFWILQSGVSALIAILALIILYIRKLFRQRAVFTLGILGLAAPMLIQAQLSSPFIFSSIHLLLPLFFLQYAIRNDRKIIRFHLDKKGQLFNKLVSLFLAIVLSYLAWYSVKSIEDAYNYEYRLFLTAKQTPEEINNMRYFEYASLHPSFKHSVHGVMNSMVVKALEINNRYDIQRFIWWAEEQAVESRSERTKENLAKAHSALNY